MGGPGLGLGVVGCWVILRLGKSYVLESRVVGAGLLVLGAACAGKAT